MNVYYLGPNHTFSHQAALKIFQSSEYKLLPLKDFNEVFLHLKDQDNSLGVVPIENSITSNVHENIDNLFSSSLKIVGEAYLPIKLFLVGAEGTTSESIEKIYSHPKALEQCQSFLHKKGYATEATSSTSKAASTVKVINLPTHAAITGSAAVAHEHLTVVEEDIGDIKNNFTRFAIVSQIDVPLFSGEKNKLSIIFKVKHQPGALLEVLKNLEQLKANVTKIESRPIPGTDWEYQFWIDFEVTDNSPESALEAIEQSTLEYKVLGQYPIGTILE